jgi:membrane-bound lytic murein transglycosylase MltF
MNNDLELNQQEQQEQEQTLTEEQLKSFIEDVRKYKTQIVDTEQQQQIEKEEKETAIETITAFKDNISETAVYIIEEFVIKLIVRIILISNGYTSNEVINRTLNAVVKLDYVKRKLLANAVSKVIAKHADKIQVSAELNLMIVLAIISFDISQQALEKAKEIKEQYKQEKKERKKRIIQ